MLALGHEGIRSPFSQRHTTLSDTPSATLRSVWFQPFSSIPARSLSAGVFSFAMTAIIDDRENLSIGNRQTEVSSPTAAWQTGRMSFGARLKEARKARGLTSTDLGARAGMDNSAISRWENGQRAPRGVFVSRLARELGVTERWLLTGEGPREPGPVQLDTPIGAAALDVVLFQYNWPDDVSSEVVTEVEALARADAHSPAGRDRSASAWRHRIGELLREHRKPRSKPRLSTGGPR